MDEVPAATKTSIPAEGFQTIVRSKGKALAVVDGNSDSLLPPSYSFTALAAKAAQPSPKQRGGTSLVKPQDPKDDPQRGTPTRLDVLAQTAAALQLPTAAGVLAADADAVATKRKLNASAGQPGVRKRGAQVLASPTTSASDDDPQQSEASPHLKKGRPGKQAAPPATTTQPGTEEHAAPARTHKRRTSGRPDEAGPFDGIRASTLTVSLDVCTAVLAAIRTVRVTGTPSSAPSRRLRHKEGALGPPAAALPLEDSSEEEGEDGWKPSQVEALHKWYHLLNPQLPDFWQQVANMVGRSKQECMDKHFEGMEQGGPLGTRNKPARPHRYLAALREDAPPPALGGRGVGPAAVRRAARTAWWAQRAEQRGLTALDDEDEEDGGEEREEFLAEMAEQERTDRYIDNLRKRSKLLRSKGAWAAAKRGTATRPVVRGPPTKGADPTAIARRLLAQTQQSDEDEEEEEVDEYMSASDDEFHSMM